MWVSPQCLTVQPTVLLFRFILSTLIVIFTAAGKTAALFTILKVHLVKLQVETSWIALTLPVPSKHVGEPTVAAKKCDRLYLHIYFFVLFGATVKHANCVEDDLLPR